MRASLAYFLGAMNLGISVMVTFGSNFWFGAIYWVISSLGVMAIDLRLLGKKTGRA